MKILIVDDEKLARERLKDLIEECSKTHVIREEENGLAAIRAIEKEPPDVVLMDIRMPVMDGLEAAYHLATMKPAPAVVFTTAYQDHALDAFEANAVDYLLKPIRRKRLQQALERAEVINRARIATLRNNDPGARARSHLGSNNMGRIELIPVTEIRFMKAEQKYVMVGWQGRETLIDESLKSLEAEFPDLFLRIHRNALVSLNYVEALEKDRNGKHKIHLRGVQEGLEVSRRHLHGVRLAVRQRTNLS